MFLDSEHSTIMLLDFTWVFLSNWILGFLTMLIFKILAVGGQLKAISVLCNLGENNNLLSFLLPSFFFFKITVFPRRNHLLLYLTKTKCACVPLWDWYLNSLFMSNLWIVSDKLPVSLFSLLSEGMTHTIADTSSSTIFEMLFISKEGKSTWQRVVFK